MDFDCGGDCLFCMASHGDPDAIEAVERLTGEKVNVWGSLYRSSKVKGPSLAKSGHKAFQIEKGELH